jgi:16S rRNA (uracil1498-N3)-methyltransferase
MGRRRFFVDEVRNQQAELLGDDAHHLVRVLRVEKGQRFEISDNRNVYLSEVIEARKDRVTFAVLEKLPSAPPASYITLLLALTKFDRFEWALEKCTEAGVYRFIPVMAARSEKGIDRAAPKRLTRWRRIVLEASQQSRRDTLPVVNDPLPFRAALDSPAPHRFFLDEEPGGPPLIDVVNRTGEPTAALLVGPEGGWTETEREQAHTSGWLSVSLGPMILRAETAAVVAAALLSHAYWAATPVNAAAERYFPGASTNPAS